jgi:predicted transcriptional regulator
MVFFCQPTILSPPILIRVQAQFSYTTYRLCQVYLFLFGIVDKRLEDYRGVDATVLDYLNLPVQTHLQVRHKGRYDLLTAYLRHSVCRDNLWEHFSIWGNMKKVAVTCRLDAEAVAFLETLGAQLDRDRSYLINDAVAQYINLHRWQIEEVKKGLAEADRGEFASEEEVNATFDELTR